MGSGAVLALALFAAAGGVAGGALVPWCADKLLSRAYRRALAWWWQALERYEAFKARAPDREPRASAAGEEGALGVWLADALCAARAGSLARERAHALERAGIDTGSREPVRDEAEQARRCSFRAAPAHRAALAASCALACTASCALWAWPVALAAATCACAMAVGIVCDLRARMLPWECCAAIAVLGGAFQLMAGGWQGLATGAVLALAVCAACSFANRWSERRGVRAIGYGDVRCMAALSVAAGPATFAGMAACYLAAAAFSCAGMAAGRLKRSDGVPMAPFLALWLVVGVLAPLHG